MKYPLSIKAAKATDLTKLASLYVPATAENMYTGLQTVEDDSEDTSTDE